MDKKVTAVEGFQFNGIHAGLKKSRPDLALIYAPDGAEWAAVFTRNLVKAAPVEYGIKQLKTIRKASAVLVNSGNANACTGEAGFEAIEQKTAAVAKELGINSKEVLVSSTGIIGVELPTEPIVEGVAELVAGLSPDKAEEAAEAIRTTDTFTKTSSTVVEIEGKKVSLLGIAKGSGMLHPNMGTMLAYVVTDANIEQVAMQEALQTATDQSFNAISVDGDTSTNDSLFLLSSQKADHALISDSSSPGYSLFEEALLEVCQDLAQQMAKDGEGATKFVEVVVKNAKTVEDAIQIGRTVATSNLVKTAIYGGDPNWGRIIAAVGYAGVDEIDPENIGISFVSKAGQVTVCEASMGVDFDEGLAKEVLDEADLIIEIDLNFGEVNASVWTCDFSVDYVKLNADYRS